MTAKSFVDTNILLYAVGDNSARNTRDTSAGAAQLVPPWNVSPRRTLVPARARRAVAVHV